MILIQLQLKPLFSKVVALNSNWKIPVGYFLIAGLSGTERANLVKQSLMKLHDVGVRVVSLTYVTVHLAILV